MADFHYLEYDGCPNGVLDAPINTVCADLSSPTLYHKTTGEGTLTGWRAFGVNNIQIMATGDLRMMVEGANGQLIEKVIPKGTSQLLGTDSNGNLVLTSPQVLPKAGTLALTSAMAGTANVVFNAAFATGTTYVVEMHFNGVAIVFTVTNQTVTGFTFTYLSSLIGTAYWTATPITG